MSRAQPPALRRRHGLLLAAVLLAGCAGLPVPGPAPVAAPPAVAGIEPAHGVKRHIVALGLGGARGRCRGRRHRCRARHGQACAARQQHCCQQQTMPPPQGGRLRA
ncbi:MAG: hypothetical protein ACKOBF_12265, partial [Limnohabitans sp.]